MSLRQTRRGKLAACLLAFVAAAIVFGASAVPAEQLIKMAHPNRNDPFDNGTAAMAVVFKNQVEANSGGDIRVDIYPEGQLGRDAEVIMLVKEGVIQSAISTLAGFARNYPLIGVLDQPFAYPSIASTYEVLDGEFGQRLSADIKHKTGVHVLGYGDSGGFFAITNSRRAIKSLADMRGLKIRTLGLETHNIIIRSLGGEPIAIAFSELYSALQAGVVDGQMNPVPIIRFAQLDQVQKYITVTRLIFAPYIWVMNVEFWNKLSEQQRALVDDAAYSAIVANRGLNRIIEASDRGLPSLKQRMDVYVPSEMELKAFREAAQPAVREYIEKALGSEGAKLQDALLAAIEQARNRVAR